MNNSIAYGYHAVLGIEQLVLSRLVEALYEGHNSTYEGTTIPDVYLVSIPGSNTKAYIKIAKPYLELGATRKDQGRNITLFFDVLDVVGVGPNAPTYPNVGRVMVEAIFSKDPVSSHLILDFSQAEAEDISSPDTILENLIKIFLPPVLRDEFGKRSIPILSAEIEGWGLNNYDFVILPENNPPSAVLAFYDNDVPTSKGEVADIPGFLSPDKPFQLRMSPLFLVESIIRPKINAYFEQIEEEEDEPKYRLIKPNEIKLLQNKLRIKGKFNYLEKIKFEGGYQVDISFTIDPESNTLNIAPGVVNLDLPTWISFLQILSFGMFLTFDIIHARQEARKALIAYFNNNSIDFSNIFSASEMMFPFFEEVELAPNGMNLSGTIEAGRILSAGRTSLTSAFLGIDPKGGLLIEPVQSYAILPSKDRTVKEVEKWIGRINYDLLANTVQSPTSGAILADLGVTNFEQVGTSHFDEPDFKPSPISPPAGEPILDRLFLVKPAEGYFAKFRVESGSADKPVLLRWVTYKAPIQSAITIDVLPHQHNLNEYYRDPVQSDKPGDAKWRGSDRYYSTLTIRRTRLHEILSEHLTIQWEMDGIVGTLSDDNFRADLEILTENLDTLNFENIVRVKMTDPFGRVFTAERIFRGSLPYFLPSMDVPQMDGHWKTRIIPDIYEKVSKVIHVLDEKQLEFGINPAGKYFIVQALGEVVAGLEKEMLGKESVIMRLDANPEV